MLCFMLRHIRDIMKYALYTNFSASNCTIFQNYLVIPYLSSMFDIFIIAFALWMYDHAFIVQK